jgi:UDP-N-acetylmuramoyl-tripeptide--D-alanyl-D-alanine ligase
MLSFADVIEALTGVRPQWANQVITEAVVDSRQVIPGSMFVAMPGERVDGHDYVDDAFKHGASLALVQRDIFTGRSQPYLFLDIRDDQAASRLAKQENPRSDPDSPICLWVENSLRALQQIARFWRRRLDLKVIGITGSVGKSTTKELVSEVLSQRYRTLKNPGNLNNEIGLPLTLLSLSEGHERAVLEMGFYVPGEIAFLCDLALPQIGVVTNVGTVHAERAGSVEAIARGKAELVQALPKAPEGVAILNYDDPLVRDMAQQTRARVFTYGLDPEADLWADNVEGLGLEGIRFQLHFRDEVLHLRVPMLGRHSVHTALRATAVGLVDGLTWQEIVGGLRSGKTQLRLVAVRSENGALILDDTYNASPQSTLAALNLLDELEGRKVAVLGDMLELGAYARRGHEMVGIRASEVVDELICVGELAMWIAQAAGQSGLSSKKIQMVDDVQAAIAFLRPRLTAQDIVLVKGSRGMRMERIVAGLEEHS